MANTCGVCNEELDMEQPLYHKTEKDGNVTSYHLRCGGKANYIKPCEACDLHRIFCSECKE